MVKKIYLALFTIFMVLSVGTIVYHYLEGWDYIDSLYFSTITLSTIGYGDMYPTRRVTKIFTIFYIFFGVGTMLYELTQLKQTDLETKIGKSVKLVKNKIIK